MIAALIFLISLVALGPFSIFYWRAILAAIAAEPLSDRVRTAAGVASEAVGAEDFGALIRLHNLCPALEGGGRAVSAVQTYYRGVATLGKLCGSRFPALSGWAHREMATCSRYVAVILDQRLERNLACQAEIHSC